MKILKRITVFVLSVCLVFFSIGSKWIDTNRLDKVYAADPISAELSAEVLAFICMYVGSVYIAYVNNEEIPSLTESQIAEVGHNILKSARYSPIVNIDDAAPGATPEQKQALMVYLDSQGQPYVFGSEALQEAADESWTVIQGGMNEHNDDDDGDGDDDESKDNIIKFVGNVGKCSAAISTAFAAAFGVGIKAMWNKMLSGEDDEIAQIFAPIRDQTFRADDIARQRSGTSYVASFALLNSYTYKDPYTHKTSFCRLYRWFETSVDFPMAVYHEEKLSNNGMISHNCAPCCYYMNDVRQSWSDDYFSQWKDGKQIDNHKQGSDSWTWDQTDYNTYSDDYLHNLTCSLSGNIPIFDNQEDAYTYLKTGKGYGKARNYVTDFQIADWLQKDWSGTLIDPLTGLSSLSDWFNRARHNGLNSMGHEMSYEDFLQYLRDYFTNAGLGKDVVYDPALDPIVYPIGTQTPVIDPGTNPSIGINPGTDPGTDPTPDPKPDPDPSPGTGPTDNTDYDSEEIEDDIDDMNKSFKGLSDILQYKFPFCIPWDILAIVGLFSATPEIPYFEIPIKFDVSLINISVDYTLVVDFKDFEILSKISRFVLAVSYCVGLIRITFGVVNTKKE